MKLAKKIPVSLETGIYINKVNTTDYFAGNTFEETSPNPMRMPFFSE